MKRFLLSLRMLKSQRLFGGYILSKKRRNSKAKEKTANQKHTKPKAGRPIVRIVLGVGIFLIVIILGYFGYNYVSGGKSASTTNSLTENSTASLTNGVNGVVSNDTGKQASPTPKTSDNLNTPSDAMAPSKPSMLSKASKIPTSVDASQINPSENVTLTIGLWPVSYRLSDLENGPAHVYVTDNVTFIVYAENGKVYVDASVYGGPNFASIQIHGTSFVVVPGHWDQNYDENKFEVVNQDGDPVFQLIYESQFHIVIYGIFPTPNGLLLWATPSGMAIDPGQSSIFHLDPIFKYPSSKYLGQLRDTKK